MTGANDAIPRSVWRIATVIVFGAFMAGLDTSLVNVGLTTIAHELGARLTSTQWVTSGYLFAIIGIALLVAYVLTAVRRARNPQHQPVIDIGLLRRYSNGPPSARVRRRRHGGPPPRRQNNRQGRRRHQLGPRPGHHDRSDPSVRFSPHDREPRRRGTTSSPTRHRRWTRGYTRHVCSFQRSSPSEQPQRCSQLSPLPLHSDKP